MCVGESAQFLFYTEKTVVPNSFPNENIIIIDSRSLAASVDADLYLCRLMQGLSCVSSSALIGGKRWGFS